MNFPERFLETLEENDMEYRIADNRLISEFLSLSHRYRLNAEVGHDGVVLTLDSGFFPDKKALHFLAAHGEMQYPLFRRCSRNANWQIVLDKMQSSADDFLGFAQDIAEGRHTVDSAEAALACAKSYRDTPGEIAMLDSLLAERMRDHVCAWYPSAGDDCRDLLYLCGEYPGISVMPDLFIHTDALPPKYINGGVVYQDQHTSITATFVREYDRLPKMGKEFAHWQETPGYAAEYQMKIKSDRFGTFEKSLLYVSCENEFFAAHLLVPNRIVLDVICHIRYGNGFGGANNTGAWLTAGLKILRTKYFISDPFIELSPEDDHVLGQYPQLNGHPSHLESQMVIPSRNWSGHGDVSVYRVR